MNDGHSNAMLLNLGLHFIRSASFEQYQKILNGVIKVIQQSQVNVVWRTTTSIYKRQENPEKRFQTNQVKKRTINPLNCYCTNNTQISKTLTNWLVELLLLPLLIHFGIKRNFFFKVLLLELEIIFLIKIFLHSYHLHIGNNFNLRFFVRLKRN